jgi:DNA transformation protein
MRSAPGPKKRREARKPPARPRERLAPLRVSDAFKAFVLAQFEELGEVVPRSMFGGVGLYRGGVFFGIIARDTLFLKVDDRNRRDYERAKMPPFKPYAHRSGTMQYFAVPVTVLESPADLATWARKSIAVAEGE